MADNVLNLSAFGEVIEPSGKREYKKDAPVPPVDIIKLAPIQPAVPAAPAEKSASEKSNCVASSGLKNIAQIKLLHWQTYSQVEHVYLDQLFNGMIELIDTLTESVMGKYGRPELTEEERKMAIINYMNPESPDGLPQFMSNLDKCYRETCYSMFNEKDDSEILNIIQEILALIDKTKYLLTLKK
jgi:hypothetical protein